jgi:hypothetical protein
MLAASVLADLVNQYDRGQYPERRNLDWRDLVLNAFKEVAAYRASGKLVPDPVK